MGFFGIDQVSFADDGSIIFGDTLALEVERRGSVSRTAILRCAPDRPIPTSVPPSLAGNPQLRSRRHSAHDQSPTRAGRATRVMGMLCRRTVVVNRQVERPEQHG